MPDAFKPITLAMTAKGSFGTLQLEIEGRWPWQRGQEKA